MFMHLDSFDEVNICSSVYITLQTQLFMPKNAVLSFQDTNNAIVVAINSKFISNKCENILILMVTKQWIIRGLKQKDCIKALVEGGK